MMSACESESISLAAWCENRRGNRRGGRRLRTMSKHGPVVIVAILFVALAMSAFAWWYRAQQSRRAMAFWGAEFAWVILRGEQVEVARLERAGDVAEDASSLDVTPIADGTHASETVTIQGQRFLVRETKVISGSPGLVHARHALVEDASYDWLAAPTSLPGDVAFLLRFSDGRKQALAAFDLNSAAVVRLHGDSQQAVSISPILAGLRKFFTRHYPATAPASS
jgi:hypothetical protein